MTLACEDGQQMEAHKVILASNSPFFMELLRKNKHPHPLIYLRGIKFDDLMAIVDFLYFGEANVFQENLDVFLALAEELRLKGLTESADSKESEKEVFVKHSEMRLRATEDPRCQRISNPKAFSGTDLETSMASKVASAGTFEPSMASSVAVNSFTVNVEGGELDDQIGEMISTTDKCDQRGRKLVRCNVCGKEGQRADVVRHIEAIHITGVSHSCDICGKTSRSRNALRKHKRDHHIENQTYFQE